MTPHGFLKLQDLVLVPPLPAVLSLLLATGIAYVGWHLAHRLRGRETDALDLAAGFIVAAAIIAAVVHGLALAQLSTVGVMRSFAFGLAALGGYALVHHWAGITVALRREIAALWAGTFLQRAGLVLAGLTIVGLATAALGPPTDADSLDYHLGVPLDWLRHGGAYSRPDWFNSRLIGITESLNLLGLAAGTDCLGAVLQLGALAAAGVAVSALASTRRDLLLGWLLVVSCPMMAFLVPNQKPQLLPAAATTIGLVIAVRRFSAFGLADALLALGCAAFAAASKVSFLLSGGFVVLVCLAAARKNGRPIAVAGIAAAAFSVLLLPLLLRNLVFFGDPVSPFLEPFRLNPDPAVVSFAAYLRVASGKFTAANLIRLPWKIVATVHPGEVTSILGLGALAFLPTLSTRGKPRTLLLLAFACTVVILGLGQIAPRFFLEPYFWAGAALVAVPWTRWKGLLFRGLVLQGALSASVALFGAATLFPGALSPRLREGVMVQSAAGYAEAQWLDHVLPPDAVLVTAGRFHALIPRPFAVADSAMVDNPALADQRFHMLIAERGVDTLVLKRPRVGAYLRFGKRCGEPFLQPAKFALATRNPLNRQQYEVRLFRLNNCDRVSPAPSPP